MDVMASRKELQNFVSREIPLVGKAGFKILELNRKIVRIGGSLEENKNHHNTAFGGSISVNLILSGWAMVREVVKEIDPEASIVIASQSVKYLKPVTKNFEGRCTSPAADAAAIFSESYRKRGVGKIGVSAILCEEGAQETCASFEGVFVAKRSALS